MTNDEGMPNHQVTKATRGRVRTPKASAKQNNPVSGISHAVLWSAMRPRIALTNVKSLTRCFRLRSRLALEERIASPWQGEGRVRVGRVTILFVIIFAVAPISTLGAGKNRAQPHLPGYKAVRVHYDSPNKMLMSVRINGQFADLLVDTGSNRTILDAEAAETFGIRPSQRGSTRVNGQLLPIGFMRSLTAGSMSFGSSPVVLRHSARYGAGTAHVDGVLGLDLLFRHKAVINCRTRVVFFKVDQSRHMNLSAVASSENFTRIPLHREASGALTVSCSIQGQSGRLLVDTGAFLTTFPETFLESLGISFEPTRLSAQFPSGTTRPMSAAQINDLKIGDFKVPSAKFGVAALPQYALRQGSTRISGILGMDTLYICHAIIDLDGMNLFLK